MARAWGSPTGGKVGLALPRFFGPSDMYFTIKGLMTAEGNSIEIIVFFHLVLFLPIRHQHGINIFL